MERPRNNVRHSTAARPWDHHQRTTPDRYVPKSLGAYSLTVNIARIQLPASNGDFWGLNGSLEL